MRKRGAVVLASGVPIWLLLVWYVHEVTKSLWGYEFGSVAMPPPTWFRGAQLVALLSLLIGSYLLVADFIRWRIKGSNAAVR
jgi:hypothetical protein